jgi:hypothetical protein
MTNELKEAISLIRNMDAAEIAMISEVVTDQKTFLGKQKWRVPATMLTKLAA